jgi:hypothetical protein
VNPDLNQIDIHKVLFWIIIVLVAGFIGQFGKSYAKHLIERFRKKPTQVPPPGNVPVYRPPEGPSRSEDNLPPAPGQAGLSKEEAKIRKKELKAELKNKKKEAKD